MLVWDELARTRERLHRSARSKLGAALETRVFESLAEKRLEKWFRLTRIAALAKNALARGDGEQFVAQLESESSLSSRQRRRARAGLRKLDETLKRVQEIDARWESAFFGDRRWDLDDDELASLDWRRRCWSERALYPASGLGFLAGEAGIPCVSDDVVGPDAFFAQFGDMDPKRLYQPRRSALEPERSRSFCGESHREYFLRFRSPADGLGDSVQARVFEPRKPRPEAPAVIYCGGLGMSYDLLRAWPDEAYVGLRLAERGCRVILPESPWHGRRTPPGRSSGELALASGPFGFVRLIAAQLQEIAALVGWAREQGAPVVAVGGISFGAIVAEHVSSRSYRWPVEMRPDAIFLDSAGLEVHRFGRESRLLDVVGMRDRLEGAGWTAKRCRDLVELTDPESTPAVDPDQHVVLLARRDDFVSFDSGCSLVKAWRVPEANVFTVDAGHVGIPAWLVRHDDVQSKWLDVIRLAGERRRARPVEADRVPIGGVAASVHEERWGPPASSWKGSDTALGRTREESFADTSGGEGLDTAREAV